MRKGAIVLFKDGYCFQSYGWKFLRPLGKLQNILDHLEEYEVDEISIIRPVRMNDSDNSFYSDLKILSKLKTSTPISFGGGLLNYQRVKDSRILPFERLVFSSQLFLNDSNLIKKSSELLGRQAILGCLPFKFVNNDLNIFDSSENIFKPFNNLNYKQLDLCDEILTYDTHNEGFRNSFDKRIFENDYLKKRKIIVSGGAFSFNKYEISKFNIASKLIENKALHQEYSIKRLHEK